jgi:hypothetical protein
VSSFLASQTPAGKSLPPPVYYLAATADKRDGDHSNDVWRARVVHDSLPNQSLPMMVKALTSQVSMAVEIACALAARELRLPVPLPGLVYAERSMLLGIRPKYPGEVVLLVGSHYQRPDALLAELLEDNPAGEELVWQRLCETPTARQGAVLDELIANPDRHCENVLFDGVSWWLFDHDQALAPAATFVAKSELVAARQAAIDFTAKANRLAHQLLLRHRDKHGILEQIRKVDSGSKRLHALAQYSRHWTHPDPRINETLQLVGVVLGLIHLRLPALAEKINARLGNLPPTPSLWSEQ